MRTPSNNGPSVTVKTAAAKAKAVASKAKEIARLKRWESEQAAELEKCVKFVETTCGCTLADGKPCSTLLPLQYYVDYRAQVFFLSREQLDMVLLGNVASNIREDYDVGTGSGSNLPKGYGHAWTTNTRGTCYAEKHLPFCMTLVITRCRP